MEYRIHALEGEAEMNHKLILDINFKEKFRAFIRYREN